MDQLRITPSEVLTFRGDAKGRSSALLTLENVTDRRMAFKVKTTNPVKYSVKPSSAYLEPRQRVDVVLVMKSLPTTTIPTTTSTAASLDGTGSKRDKFLVQFRAVTVDDARRDLSDIFASKTNLLEVKLTVAESVVPMDASLVANDVTLDAPLTKAAMAAAPSPPRPTSAQPQPQVVASTTPTTTTTTTTTPPTVSPSTVPARIFLAPDAPSSPTTPSNTTTAPRYANSPTTATTPPPLAATPSTPYNGANDALPSSPLVQSVSSDADMARLKSHVESLRDVVNRLRREEALLSSVAKSGRGGVGGGAGSGVSMLLMVVVALVAFLIGKFIMPSIFH